MMMKLLLFFSAFISLINAASLSFLNSTEPKYHMVHFKPIFNNDSQVITTQELPFGQVVEVETEEEAELYPDQMVHVLSTGSIISPWVHDPLATGEVNGLALPFKKYEVKLGQNSFFRAPIIPISPCHDSRDGFGGSTGYSGSLGVSNGVKLSLDLGTLLIRMIDITVGVTVSKSISASESISCAVKEGDVVQVFVEPWVLNADYSYRTYYSLLDKKKLNKSDWTDANNDFLISVTPAPFCHTGLLTTCGITPQNTLNLPNGAYV